MNKDQFTIDWPEINFRELETFYIEEKHSRFLYKTLLAILVFPEIIIGAFYEVLKFKA